ncbi:nuclear valosin-containing protein-like isoform X2 [Notothenia coriiceps]|nr:PREDICTED: nuclear valosin-containing protein-like isoform X2 [Notothenia coriiceps]
MKNRSGVYVDNRLKQRVEQYMATCSSEYVDLSAMAVKLQRLHRMDYGRRNRIAFRLQVEKVYDILMKDSGIDDLENKHMVKRAKHANKGTG